SEEIPVTPVTVFVGPNNSGKSRILREIERYCKSGQKEANSLLLSKIDFKGPSLDEGMQLIERLQQSPNPNEVLTAGHIIIGSPNIVGRIQVSLDELIKTLQFPQKDITVFCQWFLGHFTMILNGGNRINLVNMQDAGDLQQTPQNSFQTLLRNDAK